MVYVFLQGAHALQKFVYFNCGYFKYVHNMFLLIIVLPNEMDYSKVHPK